MVYRMYMRIDGGCRRNGSDDPIGAAAVCTEYKYGRGRISTYCLEEYPKPTSQSKPSAFKKSGDQDVDRADCQERNYTPSFSP